MTTGFAGPVVSFDSTEELAWSNLLGCEKGTCHGFQDIEQICAK